MIRSLRPMLAAAAVAIAGGAVYAQPPADRSPGEMIRRADTDGDGKVSRDEFIKARTVELETVFGRIDTDGDGKLDEQEVGAAAERMRSMGAGGREGVRRPEGPRPDGDMPRGEEAFNRLDRDGDGRLSREEFAEGMARLREFMQRSGNGPGMPDRGGRGSEEGFRRPPRQD